MGSERPNIVVIVSDEHVAEATGCYGHPTLRTPNLDRLASDGVVYENAYCNSPMCVPSRLSFFSGRYVHQIGAWDNGVIPGRQYRTWGHHLAEAGYESVIVGRTHFNGPDRLQGFTHRLLDDRPSWIDDSGLPPERTPEWRRASNSHVTEAGPGDHPNTRHDVKTTDLAVEFLRNRAQTESDDPFLLYVGYMHPHFPLIAPPEFLSWYDPDSVPLPPTRREDPKTQHPMIAQLRHAFRNDEPLTEEQERLATACYWALTSHLDHQVGRLLEAIDGTSLRSNTVVIYTSDHGEMAGHHGIWQKQCFYEPAVHVPMIVRPPSGVEWRLPARINADVSLVDLLPTLRALAGLPPDETLPGTNILAETGLPERPVFAEYHAQGMTTGGFMLKRGNYKYCAYPGYEPQLFDVRNDPLERHDLAADPAMAGVREKLAEELVQIADPEVVDQRAKADQERRRAAATRVNT